MASTLFSFALVIALIVIIILIEKNLSPKKCDNEECTCCGKRMID